MGRLCLVEVLALPPLSPLLLARLPLRSRKAAARESAKLEAPSNRERAGGVSGQKGRIWAKPFYTWFLKMFPFSFLEFTTNGFLPKYYLFRRGLLTLDMSL